MALKSTRRTAVCCTVSFHRANKRIDAYGGSEENHWRLVLAVCAAVRAAVGPSVAVGVRLSAEDHSPGGMAGSWSPALRGVCDVVWCCEWARGPAADSSDEHAGWRHLDDLDDEDLLPPPCQRISIQAHAQHEHGGG